MSSDDESGAKCCRSLKTQESMNQYASFAFDTYNVGTKRWLQMS